MPQVDIIERQNQLNRNTPGSITSADEKTITRINPAPADEALREAPGMHVVDENNTRVKIVLQKVKLR